MADATTEEAAHYHKHRRRLRERFLKSGFAGFAEHEVVELLLTLCIPRKDVKERAKELLDRFGSVRGIPDAQVSDLQQVKGIGEVAPVALQIIRSTANLYLQQKAEEATILASADSLKTFWRTRLGGLRNEMFEVAYRTRNERKLPLESDQHTYDKAGAYTVMVKVVDIFGNDTSQAFEVEVR